MQTYFKFMYDPAGNVIANAERNITSISYDPSKSLRTDHRNLAQEIVTTTGYHRYSYDYTGKRIGKQYKLTNDTNWDINTRYIYGAYGELVAQYDGSLSYWNIRRWADTVLSGSETIGRAYPNGDRFYYLKDHASTTLSTGLGSVRVTVNNSSTAVGWNACPEHSRRDYYPFGLHNMSRLAGMNGRSGNATNPHSDQKFLGMLSGAEAYHAGARLYDPVVPRFLRGE